MGNTVETQKALVEVMDKLTNEPTWLLNFNLWLAGIFPFGTPLHKFKLWWWKNIHHKVRYPVSKKYVLQNKDTKLYWISGSILHENEVSILHGKEVWTKDIREARLLDTPELPLPLFTLETEQFVEVFLTYVVGWKV